MPAMHLYRLGKTDPPLPEFQAAVNERGLLVHDQSGDWSAVVIESGMASGEPSVLLWVPTDAGIVVLETSLAALRAAARGLSGMAEAHFGWTEGP